MLPYYSPSRWPNNSACSRASSRTGSTLAWAAPPAAMRARRRPWRWASTTAGDQFPQQVRTRHGCCAARYRRRPRGRRRACCNPPSTPPRNSGSLGSSDFGGALAATARSPFCLRPLHQRPWRPRRWRGSTGHGFEAGYEDAPYSAAAVFVICADTERGSGRADERAVDIRTPADGVRRQRADSSLGPGRPISRPTNAIA